MHSLNTMAVYCLDSLSWLTNAEILEAQDCQYPLSKSNLVTERASPPMQCSTQKNELNLVTLFPFRKSVQNCGVPSDFGTNKYREFLGHQSHSFVQDTK